MNYMKKLKLGTRASPLALTQSKQVRDLLLQHWPDLSIELVEITTTGDKVQDRFLKEVGGKGLFIKEIEQALLDGMIDFAVHSMKDLPMELAEGLSIAAIPERQSPADLLILKNESVNLTKSLCIGTSSDRRVAQLKRLYPHWRFKMLRGNIDTRLRKCESGEYDGVILAEAGLNRMQITPQNYLKLSIIASPGQGALALEARTSDQETFKILRAIHHEISSYETIAERAVIKTLGGDCFLPMGAFAKSQDHHLNLKAFVATSDGSQYLEDAITGNLVDAASLGINLAKKLLKNGADKIIEQL